MCNRLPEIKKNGDAGIFPVYYSLNAFFTIAMLASLAMYFRYLSFRVNDECWITVISFENTPPHFFGGLKWALKS